MYIEILIGIFICIYNVFLEILKRNYVGIYMTRHCGLSERIKRGKNSERNISMYIYTYSKRNVYMFRNSERNIYICIYNVYIEQEYMYGYIYTDMALNSSDRLQQGEVLKGNKSNYTTFNKDCTTM